MNDQSTVTPGVESWADPGYFAGTSRVRNTARVLRQLVFRPRGHKTLPTKSGIVLILLSLGIGSAAYNTASNILFLTLSLLLSSLLLSGLLSWINFKGTRWRLRTESHMRAGEISPVRVEISNDKKWLPTYSLWFHLGASLSGQKQRLPLERRVDPLSRQTLEWSYVPPLRGVETIAVSGLVSDYPFGFLRKTIAQSFQTEVEIWPARVPYHFLPKMGWRAHREGATLTRVGGGSELINLRAYRSGDPVRMIHWKASARQRKLFVREMADESREAYMIFIETPDSIWREGERFERLCSFAASLAEDLFLANQLWGFSINDEPPVMVKRSQDLHTFMSRITRLHPVRAYRPLDRPHGATLITFTPGAGNQVIAYVGGREAGSA